LTNTRHLLCSLRLYKERVTVFIVTFNHISDISWRSVLLVENLPQLTVKLLSHNAVSCTHHQSGIQTHVGDDTPVIMKIFIYSHGVIISKKLRIKTSKFEYAFWQIIHYLEYIVYVIDSDRCPLLKLASTDVFKLV
jgi:hypothetical protein